MSRIRFVDKNAKPQLSPGSTGYARNPSPRTASAIAEAEAMQHISHRHSDEVAQLNAEWAAKVAALEKQVADRDAEIKRLKAEFKQCEDMWSDCAFRLGDFDDDPHLLQSALEWRQNQPENSPRAVGLPPIDGDPYVRENQADVRENDDVRENQDGIFRTDEGIVRTEKRRGRPKKDDGDKPWVAAGMNERTYRRKKAKGEIE